MSTAISIRVPKKLKEEIERYKIKVSELVRTFLEEEIRKRRELENNAKNLESFSASYLVKK